MEIYVDKFTRSVLRFIKKKKKCEIGVFYKKYGENATFLLKVLMSAEYVVFTDDSGKTAYVNSPFKIKEGYALCLSPKGNKCIEDHFDRIWQWAIPTVISVLALIISIIGAVSPNTIKILILGR